MVDGNQANLIDIVDLFHGLAEAQAEHAILLAQLRTLNLQPFVGIGGVLFGRRDPVTNYSCSDYIGDKFVLLAIPGEQGRAGAAATIEFGEREWFLCGDFEFVLNHAGWPKHTNDVHTLVRTQADKKFVVALAQVTGGSGDLEFLPETVGEDLHLGSKAGLVVGQSGKGQPERTILISYVIGEEFSGTVVLGDDEVGIAIAVDVTCDDGASIV